MGKAERFLIISKQCVYHKLVYPQGTGQLADDDPGG